MTDPKCKDCGEDIAGASMSVTLHGSCCSHENVDGVERDGWALTGYCLDCGENLIGDADGWDII